MQNALFTNDIQFHGQGLQPVAVCNGAFERESHTVSSYMPTFYTSDIQYLHSGVYIDLKKLASTDTIKFTSACYHFKSVGGSNNLTDRSVSQGE